MRYTTILPPPNLSPYVRFFWFFEWLADAVPYTHLATASGYSTITFSYSGGFRQRMGDGEKPLSFRSYLQGPTTQFNRFSTGQASIGVLGVYLYPYAIPAFFARPASEVSNETIPLIELLGEEGIRLEESVLLATDNTRRLAVVIEFLQRRLAHNPQPDQCLMTAVRDLTEQTAPVNMAAFASQYSLSQRQFERKFKELAGFSPKLYARLARFEAMARSCLQEEISLTELAYQHGYYDQAHCIHEFREFSGHHPKAYLAHRADLSLFL